MAKLLQVLGLKDLPANPGFANGHAKSEAEPADSPSIEQVQINSQTLIPRDHPDDIKLSPEPIVRESEESSSESGLHQILKGTDYWFSIELSQLERRALEIARADAEAGLPRQGAIADQELPSETELRKRATYIFTTWTSRVIRNINDAIQASCQGAGHGIVQLRHTMDQLRMTYKGIEEAEAALVQARGAMPTEARPVHYHSLMKGWVYISILVGLVIIDWVANVPIFSELLPREPAIEQQWQAFLAGAERYKEFAGIQILLHRIFYHPDVSLFALGVVAFLMVMGHICGKNLRRVVAFGRAEETPTTVGIRSHRRQATFPLIASALGMILVISFLYLCRAQIKPSALDRLNEAKDQVSELQRKLQDARSSNNADAVDSYQSQLEDAVALEQARTTSYNYASGISGMNLPILLLNVVLAVTATASAYLHDADSIMEVGKEDPIIAQLEAKLSTLREAAIKQRLQIRSLDLEIQTRIQSALYFSKSFPLRESHGKVRRLEGIVPSYRAENARVRGVDVLSVLAFQTQVPLELPQIVEGERFEVPSDLEATQQELERLRSQLKPLYDDGPTSGGGL